MKSWQIGHFIGNFNQPESPIFPVFYVAFISLNKFQCSGSRVLFNFGKAVKDQRISLKWRQCGSLQLVWNDCQDFENVKPEIRKLEIWRLKSDVFANLVLAASNNRFSFSAFTLSSSNFKYFNLVFPSFCKLVNIAQNPATLYQTSQHYWHLLKLSQHCNANVSNFNKDRPMYSS